MRRPTPTRRLLAGMVVVLAATVAVPAARAGQAVPRPGADVPNTAAATSAYALGYRDGVRRGEQDGRNGREFSFERDGAYRSADRGYERSLGNRDTYQGEFRRGFAAGYRAGYERYKVVVRERRDERRLPRGYQEPAVARGYSDGYDRGLEDGRERARYDPVRHGDYRSADEGYQRQYGSKDAYKNNYRAGFRQGYDDGYRNGTRR